MKKPLFMTIKFPATQKDFNSARQKYLYEKIGQKIEIDFSVERHRKTFSYTVTNAEVERWYNAMGDVKPHYNFLIQLKKQIK